MCNILTTFQISEGFQKVITQNEVTGCAIFIANKIQYLCK